MKKERKEARGGISPQRIKKLESSIKSLKKIIKDLSGAIDEKVDQIDDKVWTIKDILTFPEACAYLGISESYMYKLTSARSIPFYKPMGKQIYFKREELNEWIEQYPLPVHALNKVSNHSKSTAV